MSTATGQIYVSKGRWALLGLAGMTILIGGVSLLALMITK